MSDSQSSSNESERIAWGVKSKAEHRWPATLAILFDIALYLFLPSRYIVGPSWLMPLFELSILLPLTISSPRRVVNEGRLQRALAIATIAIVGIANLTSLILLIQMLLYHGREITGPELFFSALDVWMTNVIIFALWFWEIDRGGPRKRVHENHSAPDFLFPQMSTPGCASPAWTPRFTDYLYVAFTNATAFSPTDAMPLTITAKMLMLIQSAISLLTVVLVAARAVNIIN